MGLQRSHLEIIGCGLSLNSKSIVIDFGNTHQLSLHADEYMQTDVREGNAEYFVSRIFKTLLEQLLCESILLAISSFINKF